ncbi:MAG: DUF4035 domain-containing protein [Betaproteobacteria bacterium]|nr:DUF4035 domain-containing protein [Betaproteobacteria bacterium]
MPVRELLARVGSDELTEWMAFYQLEPFGEMRADLRSGVVASTFANAHRTKDARAFTPEDFMPYIERTTPKDDTPWLISGPWLSSSRQRLPSSGRTWDAPPACWIATPTT